MTEQKDIRLLLETWADATRSGRKDDVLSNHAPDVLIYDVLPPLQYKSAEAYRKSLDEWWPENVGPGLFELHELRVTAGQDIAFAHGLIRCGGARPDGSVSEDWVRATFCLRKVEDSWRIEHQHISMPQGGAGSGEQSRGRD